jgi:DNA (cytosine-5)-methyltransferase 3A
MNILSLFDGQSCGQIALKELNFPVTKYYASEIDKFAILQTQHNFPNTIQLGNIENWRAWDIDWKSINLILAGSPCQGFSFAGKQLAFDDPRSRLFFVFIDILNHVKKLNPNVKFLLENVNMKQEHMRVITEYCGVFPVNINSNLVSAQNRNRWYWTNIVTKEVGLFREIYSGIPQPEDRGILLRDILEKEVDEKYFVSDAVLNRINRRKYSAPKINPQKAGTLNTKNNSGQMSIDSGTTFILQRPRGFNKGGLHKDKTPTLSSNCWEQNNMVVQLNQSIERIRRLTPRECARLQTIPDWYEWVVSESQQYKMLGNGWTVEVIKHILSFMDIKSIAT